MTRIRVLFCVAVGLLLTTGWLVGQDAKQEKKDPPTAVRGQLPQYWGKLGLSKDQIQAVYKVQAEYRGKMDELTQKLDKLKAQQQADMMKVLTAAQRERLREIIAGKAPADTEKKPDKKPGDK